MRAVNPQTGEILELVNGAWVPAQQQTAGAKTADFLAGFGRNLRQGGTFGWGDEMVGALGALGAGLPGSEAYRRAYERVRQSEDRAAAAFANEHPVTAFGAQMAGGLATGSAGKQLLSRALPGVVTAWQGMTPWATVPASGAAAGGLAGAGSAQPDERAAGAAGGTAVGGAAGAATQLIARYGGKAINAIVDRWFRQPGQGRAAKEVMNALTRDGLTPADAEAMVRAYGDDAMLADIGGQTRMLGAGVTSMPEAPKGEVERYLRQRHVAQQSRLTDALTRITGRSGKVLPDRQGLEQAGKAATSRLYEAAYQQPIQMTSELSDMLELPAVRAAYKNGHAWAERMAGRKLPALSWDDKAQDWVNPPTAEEWDWITRGLRAKAEAAFGSGRKADGMSYKALRNNMLDIMDKANPTLAEARMAHATRMSLEEALELGQRALTDKDDELVELAFNSLSLPEKEMYRRGVVKALHDAINRGGTNRDVSKLSQLNSPQFDGRMRLIFGDAMTDEFQRQLEGLGAQAATKQMYLHQTITADKQAVQERMRGASLSDVGSAVLRGDLSGAVQAGMQNAFTRPGFSPQVAKEISALLHQPVGQWPGHLVDRLGQMQLTPFWQRRAAGEVPGLLPFVTGAQAGLFTGGGF